MAERKREQGGLPDGLIVGGIGFLLGVTLLVWTATGFAGLLAHGSWPGDAHFTHTPGAMRALVGDPHDMPGAWPDAKPAELSGPGLFWGILIGQFMVLFTVTVWALNALARWRTRGTRLARVDGPDERDGPARDDVGARADDPGAYGPGARTPQGLPAPRRQGGPGSGGATSAKASGGGHGDGDGLDAWFRTVPKAVPPGSAGPGDPAESPGPPFDRGAPEPWGGPEPLTTELPPVPAGGLAARDTGLAAFGESGEITRTYALFAGPRGDKAKRIVQPAVLAAAGPVLVTTADPDTYHQTVGNRAKLGPVHVYDPAHLLDVPGRLRWAPHVGCERPGTAATRAAALLAPLRTARADEAIVHATAATLLRCWLHAAAVDGRPFRQVQRWAAGGTAAADAVRILRGHGAAASGWSGELESVLHAHRERRDAAQALIRRTLEPLNSVHIRDACNPPRSGGLDLESFTAERGTLYVVGERIEDPRTHLGAMPLLTALVSSVVEHGRRMAAASSAGRLDPPLTFVLDDVAALAPAPDLPDLLTAGHASGLPVLAVLRSPEQALARWHAPLWQDADLRLAFGDETAGSLPPAVPDAIRVR